MKWDNFDIDKFDEMPFTALIHIISKNKIKYALNKNSEFNIMPHGRYLIEIAKKDNITQEELAQIYGVSKGNIAKSLRKLEDQGYIIREIDENNRRRHIINITEKGRNFIPNLTEMIESWEKLVGITDLDDETREKIKQIAINSKKLIMVMDYDE